MIFARRSRPPRTVTAALFAGTAGLLVLIHAKCFILPDYRITFFPFVKAGSEKNSHEKNVPPASQYSAMVSQHHSGRDPRPVEIMR